VSPGDSENVTRILATFALWQTASYLRQAREKRGDGPSLSAWFYLGRAAQCWEQRKVLEADLAWIAAKAKRRQRDDSPSQTKKGPDR
jgi:hypothetical protein